MPQWSYMCVCVYLYISMYIYICIYIYIYRERGRHKWLLLSKNIITIIIIRFRKDAAVVLPIDQQPKNLSPPSDSYRQAVHCLPVDFGVFVHFTWGSPEVGSGDNFGDS